MTPKKFPFTSLLVLIGALIYVFSPLDIIPDMFLGLGQLDDIGIMFIAYRAGKKLLQYGKDKNSPLNNVDVVVDVTSKDSDEKPEEN